MAAGIKALTIINIIVDLRGKARYKRGHSTRYRGFKLTTITFVLSVLDVVVYNHIPQALRKNISSVTFS